MTKLKILLGLISIYLIMLLIHFYMLIFYWQSYPMFNSIDPLFGNWLPYVNIGSAIIYFFSFLLLAIGIVIIVRKGFFNNTASQFFKLSGRVLLIIGLLQLVKDILGSFQENPFNNASDIFEILLSFFLITLGLGVLFVVDILNNGIQIKSENDLTI